MSLNFYLVNHQKKQYYFCGKNVIKPSSIAGLEGFVIISDHMTDLDNYYSLTTLIKMLKYECIGSNEPKTYSAEELNLKTSQLSNIYYFDIKKFSSRNLSYLRSIGFDFENVSPGLNNIIDKFR